MALATVNDVDVNFVGTVRPFSSAQRSKKLRRTDACFFFFQVWAVLGLLGAVFYQLFVKTRQKALNASSWQVLHYQAPQSFLIVLLLTPVFDKIHGENGLLMALENGTPAMYVISICFHTLQLPYLPLAPIPPNAGLCP